MATWKKVIVSGSAAELLNVTSSAILVNTSFNVGTNQQITTLQATTFLTGSFTGSFTGALTGTASFATTAQTASYVLQAVSASFATLAQTSNTASYVVTAQTASYVVQAVSASFASTASYVNTLNQNVTINGAATNSLLVKGSAATGNTTALIIQNSNTSASFVVLNNGTAYSNGSGFGELNTAFGSGSLSSNNAAAINNSAFGRDALKTNSTGNNNSAFGTNALKLTTAAGNSAFGTNALAANSNGNNNTAVGKTALYSLSGVNDGNTAVGGSALYALTSGDNNIAIGLSALSVLTSGNSNTIIGANAAVAQTSGNSNTIIGVNAAGTNISGASNFIGGDNAGYSVKGSNNVILGSSAGYSTTGSSNVFLGSSAGYSEGNSNKLYIANSNTSTPLIGGDFTNNKVGINKAVTALNYNFDVSGSGNFSQGLTVTGSLIAPAITGSLQGTASWASNAVTASYALNANADLAVSGSTGNGSIDLMTQAFNILGTANEVETNMSSQTLTIGLPDNVILTGDLTLGGNDIKASDGTTAITTTPTLGDVTIAGDLQINGNDIKSSTGGTVFTLSGANVTAPGNLTVTGDLTVAGTASFTNVDNLTIKDKFILINSGSTALADSGWVTQYNAAGSGSAFYLEAGSTGTYGRFAVVYDVIGTSTALTVDEFVVSAKTSAVAPTAAPTWGGSSNGYGNIHVDSVTGNIFIYS